MLLARQRALEPHPSTCPLCPGDGTPSRTGTCRIAFGSNWAKRRILHLPSSHGPAVHLSNAPNSTDRWNPTIDTCDANTVTEQLPRNDLVLIQRR